MKEVVCALEISSSSCSLVFMDTALSVAAAKRINLGFDIQDLSFLDEALLDNLRFLLKKMRQKDEFKVKKLNVCLPQNKVRVDEVSAEMVLHPYRQREVKKRDVKSLLEQARLLRLDWDREVVHSLPEEFYLDGRKFTQAPLGVYGKKLQVKSTFCTVNGDTAEEISALAEELGLELGEVVFYPLAFASLLRVSPAGNFLLLRPRSWRTDIAVFVNSALVYAGFIPIGGEYLSQEISQSFGLPFVLSQQLKQEYGSLQEEDLKDEREVVVKKSSSYRPLKRYRLNEVLLLSWRNLLGSVRKKIKDSLWRQLSFLVLAGGTAFLPAASERAAEELGLKIVPFSLLRPEYEKLSPSFWGAIGTFYFSRSEFNRAKYAFENVSLWRKIVSVWDNYF